MSMTAIVLPTILLLTSYGGIVGVVVYRQRKLKTIVAPNPAGGTGSGTVITSLQKQQAARRQRRAVHVAATCAVVTFLFLACWLPVWVSSYLFVSGISEYNMHVHDWTVVIIYLHSCMNPLVYFVADVQFRSVLLGLFCRKGTTTLPITSTLSSSSRQSRGGPEGVLSAS